MIYVLIIILGGYSSQSGYSTVVAEFNTFEACEAARKSIVSSALPANSNDRIPQLRAHGCHAKGERK